MQRDLDSFRHGLLAAEHDGVFHRGVQIALSDLRRMRTRRLQQVGDDVIDAGDLLAHVLDYGPRWAGRRQIAADDFDDAGNPGERIANFVRQSSRHFAQRREVLGARHLGAMQALDFRHGSRGVAEPSG